MKQKFIEWFTKNNNGCSPAMEDDRSFVHEKTQHMFEAYQAGVAEGEARCAELAAEKNKAPSVEAFLAEVRAQGVDLAIEHLINKFEGTGRIGVPVMALEWLAKELRKGVQS